MALLPSVISGLEKRWGTPSRDIVSPSHNCRGRGRPPDLPAEIDCTALAMGSRLSLQPGSTSATASAAPSPYGSTPAAGGLVWTDAALSCRLLPEAQLCSPAGPGTARLASCDQGRYLFVAEVEVGLQRSSCSSQHLQIPLLHVYTDQQIILPVTNLPLSLMWFTSCLVINPGVLQTKR